MKHRFLSMLLLLAVATDLIDRGYGKPNVDFLKSTHLHNGDIVTNPPFRYALEFVQKSLNLIPEGRKVAMFLCIQFLEGKAPPQVLRRASTQDCLCRHLSHQVRHEWRLRVHQRKCSTRCLVCLAEGLEG